MKLWKNKDIDKLLLLTTETHMDELYEDNH